MKEVKVNKVVVHRIWSIGEAAGQLAFYNQRRFLADTLVQVYCSMCDLVRHYAQKGTECEAIVYGKAAEIIARAIDSHIPNGEVEKTYKQRDIRKIIQTYKDNEERKNKKKQK